MIPDFFVNESKTVYVYAGVDSEFFFKPKQNGRHFADDIFKNMRLTENHRILYPHVTDMCTQRLS